MSRFVLRTRCHRMAAAKIPVGTRCVVVGMGGRMVGTRRHRTAMTRILVGMGRDRVEERATCPLGTWC